MYVSTNVSADDAVIVWGSLDAANIVIHFPGTGNGIGNIAGPISDAMAIYDAATALDPDTAVILCLCYDVPSNLIKAGWNSERSFGLDTAIGYVKGFGFTAGQFVTASGHSFGARAAYGVFAAGLADQAVLAAPATLRSDFATDWFDTPTTSRRSLAGVYTGRADNDPIRFFGGIYGTQFDVTGASGHSQYYSRDSASLDSIAGLVVGRNP